MNARSSSSMYMGGNPPEIIPRVQVYIATP